MPHITKREGKRGATYRVRFTDPDGRERSRSFKKKALAADFAASTAHGVRAGTYVDPKAGRITVRTYLEAWRKEQAHHRPKTADSTETRFRTMVYPLLGDTPLSSVRPSTIRTWQSKLMADFSPATIRGVRGQVAGAFKDAVRDRLIPSTPFEGVKAPEVLREQIAPLTVKQVRAGQEAMPDRYRALLTLVAGTGLRAGEAWGLTRDRVDFDKMTVRVDRQLVGREAGGEPIFGPPKTRAGTRTVPLPTKTAEALREHLRKYPATPTQLMFRTARSGALTRTVWGMAWRPAAEAMGLPIGKGLHQVRHFYASALIAGGRSVKEVQERLGHASAQETLDTYAHLFEGSDEGTRAAVDAIFADEED
jgi:integrase